MEKYSISHDEANRCGLIVIQGEVPIYPRDYKNAIALEYNGKVHCSSDPLDTICIVQKKQLQDTEGRTVSYTIRRIEDIGGEKYTEIRFYYSNTGTYEIRSYKGNEKDLEETAFHWQNVMALRVIEQLIKHGFLD